VAGAYLHARSYVIKAGFAAEIDWQESLCLARVTEAEFLRESAWTVLCCGMREAVVRRCFPAFSAAFHNWTSATAITESSETCQRNALAVFRHPGKIESVLQIADYARTVGITFILEQLTQHGPAFLERFPYIGPVTSRHLAKNLGMDVAKPDRHMVRIAEALGYISVDTLCLDIARVTEHPVSVVDLVFWRYATLDESYVDSICSMTGFADQCVVSG
jgi:hypothetical protein